MSAEKKILEVKIDVSQSFLNEHDDIRKRFNYDKSTIVYEINPLVPENIISELKEILETSTSKDLVSINPAIVALAELQEIKNIKYDKEKKEDSINLFKSSKKSLTQFGTSITSVKKILKDPHIAYNKRIDVIYNLLNTEKETIKNCLEENFKEYLEEEERKKKEAEDKKKKEELEKIAELSKENEKLVAQAAKSENNKIYLQYENAVGKILTDTSVNILNLNREGLQKLFDKFSNISFEKVLKEDHKSVLSEVQISKLSQDFSANLETSKKLILDKIKSIDDSENLKDVQAQNKVLEAQTPKLMEAPEQNPSVEIPKESVQEPISLADSKLNDSQIFELVLQDIQAFENIVKSLDQKLKSYQFENADISKVRNVLTEKSLPKIKEWAEALTKWTVQKNEIIKQAYNK